MLDTVIKDGIVVDGTGSPRRRADVGVSDGRIVALGRVDEPARRTVDADGRIVAPGFVDVHTHLDAQAFWDPMLGPSPLHGVTTAIGGNCGFTIAPLSEAAGGYLMRMLARVEGMPLTSLETGVPWDWTTTAEYLDRLDGTLAINAGFKVGHSALRRVVMGEAANERTATDDELGDMVRLLRDGLGAGAMGFSSTWAETHNDANGDPVPSRFADGHELVELARVCADYPGTSLEFLPVGTGAFGDEVAELMIAMSQAAHRPLNWNVISPSAASLSKWLDKLAVSDRAQQRGAKVVGLTMPIDMRARFSFLSGFVLDVFEGWAPVMAARPEEKLRILADPDHRRRLDEQAQATPNMRHLAAWGQLVLTETFKAETKPFEGRTVGDVAGELGKDPFDALVDVAIADGLRTTFARDVPPPSAAPGLARSPHGHRRVRRGGAPRHDRRLPLRDRHARGSRPGTRSPAARGGDPHVDRLAGPPLRPARPRRAPRGGVGRPDRVRRGHRRLAAGRHPLRPAGGRRAPVRGRHRHRHGDGQRHRDRAHR
jgi:N-acyl-D-aspartate/D-glutamate deacylase